MLIINANIKTMDTSSSGISEYKSGFVRVTDGKIAAVGDMRDFSAVPLDGEVVKDAMGNLLLPGFIDPHCHIGMSEDSLGFEGDDTNEETDPVTPQLRALDAVNSLDACFLEAVNAGVTTVLTGPGSANPIAGQWLAMKTDGVRIDDMVINPHIGMKFSLGENPKNSYFNSKGQTPATRMATAALIREQLKKALRYGKEQDEALEDPEQGLPEYDIKCESLLPVLRREAKAFFHAHRADDIFTALRISKEFNLDCVLVHATDGHKIAAILASENVPVIIGPILCDRSKPELSGLTPKNAAILQRAGISISICTDHPELPIQYLPLSAAIACKEGLPYDDALRAITIDAAKIAGIDSRVGSIAVGKDADLCIFAEDPISVTSSPLAVYVNGRLAGGSMCES